MTIKEPRMLAGVTFLYVIWIALAVLTVWMMIAATRHADDDEHGTKTRH
jgi:hypothetical protein